ncbi:hypothetical protein TRFO_15130 [Tritrichomonas foetus]|uniref:Peptidase M28 domain-containing protein n=1 Tax=Tritrichomonas foetus TaxID=1144522 RepID=A0A1J4KXP3_9EUKA|nr:hypothetical protein TRFO_15130 [Tritrichomonas foetus]|eukprot:OHT14478.1 hypothetical protein TRFO_15130 [Tritrichomonas foetus]
MISSIKLFFSFSIIIGMTLFIEAVMTGRIFNDYYEKSEFFNSDLANAHHKFLTDDVRHVGSPHYLKSVEYILSYLNEYSKINNPFITMNVSDICADVSVDPFVVNHQLQREVHNIHMTLSPKNNDNAKTVFIDAHWDSHPIGVGAYDNAISAAGMLEVIHAIILANKTIPAKLEFVFIGSEEFGLHGSALLTEECKISGYYLNLEGMGGSRPYGILNKAPKSSSIVRSFASVKGALLSTYVNDVVKFLTLGSDSRNFQKCNMSGAEAAFLGNPSTYHTEMDLPADPRDISAMGHIVLNCLFNFKPDEEEKNLIAIGISPFVILLDIEIAKILTITLILIGLTSIFFKTYSFKVLLIQLMKFICASLLSLVFLCAFAFIHSCVNSFSYAPYQRMSIVAIPLISILSFLGFYELFDSSDKFSLASIQIIFDGIFAVICREMDSQIFFISSLLFAVVRIWLLNYISNHFIYIFSLILSVISFLPTSVFFAMLFKALLGYTTMFAGYLCECYPYVVAWFFVMRILVTVLSISTKNEDEITYKSSKRSSIIYFFLSIILFAFIICLPYPYSDSYLIKGTAGEYVYSNSTANVHFLTEAGLRTALFLKKVVHHATFVETFHRPLLTGPAFVKNITSTFADRWPKYEFVELIKNSDSRLVRLEIDNNVGCDGFTVIIKCGEKECVNSVEYYKKIYHKKTTESNNTVVIRVVTIPKNEKYTIDFNLSEINPIPIDIMFTFYERSKERREFLNSFPSYVKEWAKERYIGDTQLLNSTWM